MHDEDLPDLLMRRQICENYHPIPGPVNQSRPMLATPLPRTAAGNVA